MISEELELKETLFKTGDYIWILVCDGREMAVPATSISVVKKISDRQLAKYLQRANVALKDFGSFWSDLSKQFTGSLAGYEQGVLKKMILPVIVPKGIGLPELPDSNASALVVLSAGNWHGVMLCSNVHEQSILLGHFKAARNGDVYGQIERTNQDNILLIDVVSLLKREGFLTVVG